MRDELTQMPGRLDRRVQILPVSVSVGSGGFPEQSTGAGVSRWAYREDLEGSEGPESEGDYAEARARFVVRYDTTIGAYDATARLVDDGTTWNIRSIRMKPAGRPRFIEYTCTTAEE